MATSGKKGKKNKGKVISLQSFLDNGDNTPGVTQVAKKVRPRGGTEESDEDDTLPQVYQLPTAPRASRNFDDDSVPHKPPYLAYISNLPFDIKEEDIHDFFEIPIINLRLPREDGESGRLRGFGYIEFDTREDLILAISLPDPHIKNRRVRIDVSNENEQNQNNRRRDGGMNNRSRYDGFGGSSENQNRDSTDWRRDNPRPQGNDDNNRNDNRRGGGGYGYNRDRQPREPRDGSQEGGSWRTSDRPAQDTSPRRDGGDRYGRDGGGGRRGDRDREGRDGEFRSRRPPGGGGNGSGGGGEEETAPQERPKLNLKPRTLPLPEIITKSEDDVDSDTERQSTPEPPKSKGVSAASVFGSAKPVDTATREKEIEGRIEKERLDKIEKLKQERELKEKEKQIEKEKDQENNEDDVVEDKETENEKDDKENKNTTISWRIREENNKADGEQRKYSPDRRGQQKRNDDRRGGRDNRDNRDGRDQRRGGDYNRGGGYDRERENRNRDQRTDNRTDRDYNNRDRPYNNKDSKDNKDNKDNKDTKDGKIQQRDNKQRDDKPTKKDQTKIERPMPKFQPPTAGPVLQSANKYSGLLDEEDGSE